MIQAWENDNDSCTPSSGRPPVVDSNTALALQELGHTIFQTNPADPPPEDPWNGWNMYGMLVLHTPLIFFLYGTLWDDCVGVVDGTLPYDCFLPTQAEGSISFGLRSLGGGSAGFVDLDFLGSNRQPICPLRAFIAGPAYMELGSNPPPFPTYQASYHGRTGTPTYQWKVNGSVVGSGSSYTISPLLPGWYTIELRVVIGADTATATRAVEVADGCTSNCGGDDMAPPARRPRV